MLLNLLIWLIIVVCVIAGLRILLPRLGIPADLASLVMLFIGAVALIALLIVIWPLLTNPGHFGG